MNKEQFLQRILSTCEHDSKQKEKGFRDWILKQDVNFFGRIIPRGTVYIQVNGDYYHPIVNGARCPSLQVDFYIVKANPEYFEERKRVDELINL